MATLPADGYERDDLLTFLTDYGVALGAGDMEAISARFSFPALVVGPENSLPVPDAETVHAELRERLAAYRGDDLVAAVPQVVGVVDLGPALLSADVRWSYRDQNASEVASEHVRYLLRRARNGFEICVMIPVPVDITPPHPAQ